ncbi:DUF2628 domain-containing protein [Bacillus sp. BRMEA1]|uniref:DUF2628 domain-containing protein n=1 Tax=Neobacillus endophyticus TaxID=2738405 RepID=UPI001567354C|nr:DUF2628 domain-containing protein [Neobacillus endophyticus]NRD80862.1 DUF2628 domain-containing protein [Neobacillus endophyticus]
MEEVEVTKNGLEKEEVSTSYGLTDLERLKTYVGNNTDKFFKRWGIKDDPSFDLNEYEPTQFNWNWPAFFLGGWWFAYRKMFLFAIVIEVINFMITILTNSGLMDSLEIGSNVLLAIMGNWFYFKKAKEDILKIKQKNLSAVEELEELTKTGRTSVPYCLLIFAVVAVIKVTWMIVKHKLF